MAPPVLGTRALNRALLARQHLLERSALAVETMLEQLVGLQAQTPRSPYLALWSRVDAFDPESLSALLAGRSAVRVPTLRTTIHLFTADDALAIRPLVQPVLERGFRTGSPFGRRLAGVDIDEIVVEGGRLLEERPRTAAQLAALLGERWPDRDRTAMAHAVRYLVPIVQVPPRALWGGVGQATWAPLESWLGRPLPSPTDADLERLVLRYLGAFGPASVADVQAWSWLTRLGAVVERLRPALRVFRTEDGRELVDVPDGPLPDPDTPSPPRFLPDFDNVLLSHADRTRIAADDFRERAYSRIGPVPGTVLVDGFARAVWWIDRGRDAATILVEPLGRLDAADRAAVEAEAQRVVDFYAADAGRRDVRVGVP